MRLERQLLYNDKRSLSDYLRGNALNMELHYLYDLYLKNNKGASVQKCTEVQVLNEVYYQCTWITNLKRNLSPASKANMPYVTSWYKEFVKESQSEDFAEFVCCLVVGVFSVMPKRLAIVTAFTQCMQEMFSRSLYYNKVFSRLCEFKKLYGTVSLDFSPNPVAVDKLTNALAEWRQVTNSFNTGTLNDILNRYVEDDEKLAFIRLAEDKAREFNVRSTVLDFLSNCRSSIIEKQEQIIQQVNDDCQILGEIGPNGGFLVTAFASSDPRKEAELTLTKEQLANVQRERDEAWKQSVEYKQAVDELKRKLGSTSISLDEIADCILRIPKYEDSMNAFKEINNILVGTVWQTKAQDVLNKLFEKQKEQMEKMRPINAERYYAPGSIHEDKGKYLQIGADGKDALGLIEL